jgi:hypothetical protein
VYAVMNLRIPYNTGSSLAKDLLSWSVYYFFNNYSTQWINI